MSVALDAVRAALRGEAAWLVGGAVRDRLMGRPLGDIDVVVAGDVRAAARHLGLSAGGPAFPLSDEFGAWRVMGPDRAWQVDLCPLRDGSIEADLGLRDFTVNAIAEPLGGGPLLDPHDGAGDLAAHRLRMVDPRAFPDDPLRVLRLARFACELGLAPDAATVAEARAHAPALERVAGERILAELTRVVSAPTALEGLELMEALGVTAAVLPELSALAGVTQNRFHHLDVYDHTLAVLQAVIDLEDDPAPHVGDEHAAAVRAHLATPLADELTRGQALRFGALLHDIAKPPTRTLHENGFVGFPGHDTGGADLSRTILTRLRASERTRAHVADLTRHHLRLGYRVKERPLDARGLHAYLRACDPVQVDVTLLSVADRLATRGDNAAPAIAAHLELARQVIGPALAWPAWRAQPPLVRGDVLARELGITPGPALGPLLAAIDEARYAGEVADEAGAVRYAAGVLAEG
ncbi:HD domain-containing protein [Paraconexibacter antarcticus]|uniref:HD domain-containing protein n=1 Tax=Paraconexibacter antarcticus TaxID=2949664 RepID=A0ABY5E2G1_9ACTN|nr:HD domain-containing protein [Paraconexibacter antarcticus]UTI66990.1 HD domain-containing protein [Paraconexibacter antarcticus]